MIPVVTANKEGALSYQVFNDNLTTVEQINRKMLAAVVYAQTKLLNEDYSVSRKIGETAYTEAQLDTINAAATTLLTAIQDAVNEFEKTTTTQE